MQSQVDFNRIVWFNGQQRADGYHQNIGSVGVVADRAATLVARGGCVSASAKRTLLLHQSFEATVTSIQAGLK